jgi:hypothetical protein
LQWFVVLAVPMVAASERHLIPFRNRSKVIPNTTDHVTAPPIKVGTLGSPTFSVDANNYLNSQGAWAKNKADSRALHDSTGAQAQWGRALQWETRLTVVGNTGEEVSLDRFRHHPRVTLLGAVVHTECLYDTHRVFVAPTRFAAGTPYKVHEAASFGLPVVATDLLRRQTGWENGVDLLSADSTDPVGFAERVVTLYRDPELWQRLRDNALQWLRTENGLEQYSAAVRAALEA